MNWTETPRVVSFENTHAVLAVGRVLFAGLSADKIAVRVQMHVLAKRKFHDRPLQINTERAIFLLAVAGFPTLPSMNFFNRLLQIVGGHEIFLGRDPGQTALYLQVRRRSFGIVPHLESNVVNRSPLPLTKAANARPAKTKIHRYAVNLHCHCASPL